MVTFYSLDASTPSGSLSTGLPKLTVLGGKIDIRNYEEFLKRAFSIFLALFENHRFEKNLPPGALASSPNVKYTIVVIMI